MCFAGESCNEWYLILLAKCTLKQHPSFCLTSNANKVDAISVTFWIWKVMSKMGSIHTNAFTIWKNSYIFPYDFSVPKGRPPMRSALLQKLCHSSTYGGFEQRFTRNGVVILNLLLTLNIRKIRCHSTKVAWGLCKMSIETTNIIGNFFINIPPQRWHWRICASSMSLSLHNGLISHDHRWLEGRSMEAAHHENDQSK